MEESASREVNPKLFPLMNSVGYNLAIPESEAGNLHNCTRLITTAR